MPVNLINIGSITPDTSPLEVNGSLDLTGSGVGYYVNGAALITGLGVQHGAVAVGTQPAINFTDTTSATWTITNNAANNRIDISMVATGAGYLPDPTTTLGDTLVRGATAIQRLAVGANGQVIVADSGQTNGLHWANLTSNYVNLAPDINSWGTVQAAITALNSGSPTGVLTTLGDVIVRSATAPTRLAVGINGQVLQANSAATNGLNWATIDASNINLNPPGTSWTTIQEAIEGLEDVSPDTILTTKGDILGYSTEPVRVPVGATNNYVFMVDSAQGTGVKWGHFTSDLMDLNPAVGGWTTVQAAVAGLAAANPGSVLTTLGDLIVRGTTAPVRLPVGTNGQVLTADSTATGLGVAWAMPPDSPEDILTTKGDLLGFSTEPARVPVGSANDQALLVDSTTASGVAWKALIASMVGVSPAIGSWTTVQNALSSISSTLTTLSRGMAYVGFYDAATDHADFVPPLNTLDGPLPAANATGLEEGDYLVVTVAGTHPTLGALHVGDQLISTGTAAWTVLPIGTNMASVTAATVPLAPDINSWGNVQAAVTALNTRAQAAGTVGQVQFNNGGTPPAFGASANLFWDSANSRLGVGTNAPNYDLTVDGDYNILGATTGNGYAYRINGIPLAAINANGTTINLTNVNSINGASPNGTPAGAVGQIQFNNGGTPAVFGASANLFWDATNGRLGIHEPAPAYTVDIDGDLNITGDFSINGIVFAEAGSVNLAATSLTGVDGAPLKLILSDGRETDLDAVLARLEKLEALLAQVS